MSVRSKHLFVMINIQDIEKEVSFMPGFDGTGPMGAGPMTGGGRGYCNPLNRTYGRPRFGGGRGFGYGRGFGWRSANPAFNRWDRGPFYGTPYQMNPDEEVNILRREADALKNELDAINKRIKELGSQSAEV